MAEKPKMQNSESQKQLDQAEKKFDAYKEQVDQLTLDRMNEAPKLEQEPQTKIANKDIDKSREIYLKPKKSIASREPFNEKWRSDYNFQKEYVQFIAEHKELIGDVIEIWTKPFPGLPAEYWEVPSNKPVWGPRYLAEQITKCKYHRLRTEDRPVGSDVNGTYTGQIVVDNTINRLDAYPVNSRRSVFMGASR